MREQLIALREEDWDVLIVLDACRADTFAETCAVAEVVRAAGPCTPAWIRAAGPLLQERGAVYFSANPVVDREVRKCGLDLPAGRQAGIEMVPVWQSQWGRFTAHQIPSVHPLSVNGVVAAHVQMGRLEGRPLVVHYVQPHSPYIGAVPLAFARWGGAGAPAGGEFGEACHKLRRPGRAVKRGEITWEQLRAAYRANLELVWHAARLLASQLAPRRVIVTSDHGELLGEDGKFGHECGYTGYEELWRVPWLCLEGSRLEQETTGQKLEALGYA